MTLLERPLLLNYQSLIRAKGKERQGIARVRGVKFIIVQGRDQHAQFGWIDATFAGKPLAFLDESSMQISLGEGNREFIKLRNRIGMFIVLFFKVMEM